MEQTKNCLHQINQIFQKTYVRHSPIVIPVSIYLVSVVLLYNKGFALHWQNRKLLPITPALETDLLKLMTFKTKYNSTHSVWYSRFKIVGSKKIHWPFLRPLRLASKSCLNQKRKPINKML